MSSYPISRRRIGVLSNRKFEAGARFGSFLQTKLVLGTFECRHVVVDIYDGDLQRDNLQL